MPDMSGRPIVLVVDDEHVIADTLALILGKNGFAVRVAYHAEEAVRLAELLPPDIVISDVLLDGANGIRTAVRIADLAPGCHILLISGQTIPVQLFQEAHAEGRGFEVILKPVHPQKLLNKLKEISGGGEGSSAVA